ncbi:hypothetical protein EDD18DRAFT_1185363 [Armillaria luteobubalina]|uniref:MYND-type domain-containing protein n=1 Tax=Armillaria luteobubalina TaxID=153913 RepID=A0AA39PY84_9AGAR|nr:hypothetical protein EDD18DRAFT_1185363 [Armillaria luteobubalina]
METTCLVCDTPTSTRCSRCKSVHYCSKAHIALDWPSHKAYCTRVNDAGTNTFDAILFGVNETKPRLIKIPWSYGPVDEDDVGVMWQKLEKEPWFTGEDSCPRRYEVQRLGANGPSLGYTLAFWFDDNFLRNGSPINRCIQAVTGGNAAHPWSGNVFALRAQGLYSDIYEDAVMEEDLAPLIRYFKDYGRE